MFSSTGTNLYNTKVTADLKFTKPVLKKGTRKVEVLELRKLLAHWNIYIDSCTDVFDPSLENAVKEFQNRVFLEEDGIVGPLTWEALYTGAPIDMPMLTRGCSGEAVKQLQLALKAAGLNLSVVDGFFGPLTDTAVRKFQQRKGLIVDGIVGPSTWRVLSKICR